MIPMFELQSTAIRQTQQMVKEGLDAQRRATESFVQSGLDASHDAQRLGTELTQNWLTASVHTLGLMYGPLASEESRQRTLDAYADFFQGQTELVDRSLDSVFERQLESAQHVADAYPWFAPPAELAVAAETAETTETDQTAGTAETAQTAETAETVPTAETTETDQTAETTEATETTATSDTAETAERTTGETTDSEATGPETRDLRYISGIGTAYEDRLEAVGITSVAALADASPEELADQTTLPEKRLREWIEQAKDHVRGS